MTCNPNENCRRRGPFGSSYDDPICLARRAACRSRLTACVVGIIGTAAFTPTCAGCIYANFFAGGTALAACAAPCGIAALSIEQIVQNCG